MTWYASHSRNLPWRNSQLPYHIWVSEIMLQQTRVDQARPYFERFISAFPTVHDLFSAPLDEVLKNWEGLGYYSRARNLHKAAKKIVEEYGGALPHEYNDLLQLPGIGPYTAAAISSIAFNRPHGVLDGNVIRVLSRVTCNSDDTTRTKTRRLLQDLSNSLVAPDNPGDFNQAMMELGATRCTPKAPSCESCPISMYCCAFGTSSVELFPVAKKKTPVPHHNIAVGILTDNNGRLLISKRPVTQMLGGMWEFPCEQQKNNESLESTITRHFIKKYGLSIEINHLAHVLRHAYSHFKITVHAFACSLLTNNEIFFDGDSDAKWVSLMELDDFAFHRAHRKLIENLLITPPYPTLFDKI